MDEIYANVVLDAKGLACPMPIVKTKKEMEGMEPGQVIEVQATDRGSKADIKAWAESAGHQYLGTVEDGELLTHYVRKSSGEEKTEKTYPHVSSNEVLEQKLEQNDKIVVVDVREEAEYAFHHIPSSINIPLGEIEERMDELKKDREIYVICRTGNRSDVVSRKLAEAGYKHVYNVIPGMSQWTGKTASRVSS